MKRKLFHISDILSITTGRMLSTRHVEGVYDILNFMTGDNLFTHQLPRAANICKPHLLKQFPQLKDVRDGGVNADNIDEFISLMIHDFGEWLEVAPIPHEEWAHINPVTELEGMLDQSYTKIIILRN